MDLLFFLTYGQDAPCKSWEEAKNLPVWQRDQLAKRLSEQYRKQNEELEKAKRGGKGKSQTTYY